MPVDQDLWCTARTSSCEYPKGFPASRTAKKQICSRKIHWRLFSAGRSPLAWEVSEAQAPEGCRVPQVLHHTWPALTLFHQRVTGDSRSQLLLGVREVLTDL